MMLWFEGADIPIEERPSLRHRGEKLLEEQEVVVNDQRDVAPRPRHCLE